MSEEIIRNKNISSVVAIVVLLLAIPSGIWPYGYYVLLRWIITGIALFVLWVAYRLNQKGWSWLMGGIAIIFNPIIPIYLDKGTWAVIDLIVAVLFLVSIFKIRIYKIKNDGVI